MSRLFPAVIIIFISFLSLNAQPSEYELEEIEFEGNQSISSSELSGAISSVESPNWFFKFLNSISESIGKATVYFDSLKIKSDLESLVDYYRDQGFFKAQVSGSYSLNDEEKEAVISYYINEGLRFVVTEVNIDGLDEIPVEFSTKLLANNSIDSGKFYTKALIDENIGEMTSYLLNHGYMLVERERPEIIVDTVQNLVNVNLDFNPGLRYRIGEIRIEKTGESKDNIRDTILRQLIGVKPGQYYSAEDLSRGQIRLYRTNLFSSVLVNTVIADTQGNTVPLNIKADVTNLNELVPEVIMNNQESSLNFGLAASYTRKNFLGDARNFSLGSNFTVNDIFNIDYSKLGRMFEVKDTSILGYFDARLTVEQPYFLGKPIRTRLESYYTITKQKEYKANILGGRLSWDFELPRRVYFRSLLVYYSIERSEYQIVEDYLRALIKRQRNISLDTINIFQPSAFTTSILGVETGNTKTDDLLFPTQGYTLSLNFEEANSVPYLLGFGSRAQFFRAVTGLTYYPKLYASDESAFGLKFKMGYVKAFHGPDKEIPLNRRFTAGGSNSVRGWPARELSPDPDLSFLTTEDVLQIAQNVAIGGTFLLEGSVETRNRLFGPIGGALFADYGNVWNGYNNFRFNKVAVAVGFGLRFYSSFAPIRIDFGYKAYDPETRQTLLDQKFFKDIQLHIGIGEAF